MLEDQEIRERIRACIEDEISAAELEDWLETESWDDAEMSVPTQHLANDALRLLAERGNGDWTEEELAEQLGALSRLYWFVHVSKGAWADAITNVSHHDRRPVATGRSPVAESA